MSQTQSDADSLTMALQRHGVAVDTPRAVELLEQYCRLLWERNQRINLTRHTDFDTFVTRDLVDTQHLAAQIEPGKVLDVGSGGGVPGIPLAILRTDLHVSLAESVQKRAAVLQSLVQTLKLPIAVFPDRAETILQKRRFDVVTVRAVASLDRLLLWFQNAWKNIGQMLLIKGPRWSDEHAVASEAGLLRNLDVRLLDSWSAPGRDGDSVLIRIQRLPAPGKAAR